LVYTIVMSTLFSLINNDEQFPARFVEQQFSTGVSSRSTAELSRIGTKLLIGVGDNVQTVVLGDVVVSCTGTIYNARDLYKYANITPKTPFDYEIIIHMYLQYGIDHTLQMLDGDFIFVLVDNRTHLDSFKMYVARDPYGVRPLYILYPNKYNKKHVIALATEIKMLKEFYRELENNTKTQLDALPVNMTLNPDVDVLTYKIAQFPPGAYSSYFLPSKVFSFWTLDQEFYRYHSTGFNSLMYHSSPQYHDAEVVLNIQRYLIRSVEKRCASTDLPIGCLLSGGLDSSVIAGLVKQFHVTHKLGQFETFSVGMEGSEDLKYAKMVADHLGSVHHELILKKEDFIKAIPDVIRTIETYDTLTVRTSIAHYLLGKYIAENAKARFIFTGDGADEIFGGHLYMYMAAESIEFDGEVRRLLKDIHHFDLVRVHKCLSCHGLTPVVPYMDRSFIQYYLSVAPQVRFHTRNDQCEKYFLRLAFSTEYYRNSVGQKMFAEEVLWRTTEAFSDGISPKTNSLHEMLQDYTNEQFIRSNIQHLSDLKHNMNIYSEISKRDPLLQNMKEHLVPVNVEQYVYRKEFERNYQGMGELLPYFCMPKYAPKIYDPSPRTLKIYSDEPSVGDDDSDKYSDKDSDEEHDSNGIIDNYTLVPPDNFNGDFTQPIKVCVNIVTSEGTSKIAEFTPNFSGMKNSLQITENSAAAGVKATGVPENVVVSAVPLSVPLSVEEPKKPVKRTNKKITVQPPTVSGPVPLPVPLPVTVPLPVKKPRKNAKKTS